MVCALSFSLAAGAVRASDGAVWPVKHRLVSKDGDKSTNISGIACTTTTGFPRACLVIDDNMQAAQFVTVEDGELKAGETIPLIDSAYDGKPLELDGEGVAYADGWFYVMGSHGHPRDRQMKLDPVADAAKISSQESAASSQIVRIRLKDANVREVTNGDVAEIQLSSKLRRVISADPTLARFLDRRLENNGVTIEGVAVLGKRLFAGFREPSLENWIAPLLSVSLDGIFGSGPADPNLILLPLGEGRGVRDLAPFNNGLLVLAGPSAELPGATASIGGAVRPASPIFLRTLLTRWPPMLTKNPKLSCPSTRDPQGFACSFSRTAAKKAPLSPSSFQARRSGGSARELDSPRCGDPLFEHRRAGAVGKMLMGWLMAS